MLYIAHRRQREAQIEKALAAGPTRIKDMVPVLYADVDPRLYPAAARSVLAHIIDLNRRGRVTPIGPLAPDSAFQLAG